jgi:hypothetical protein
VSKFENGDDESLGLTHKDDDGHWLTIDENFTKLWGSLSVQSEPKVFKNLIIAPDGGLNDGEMQVLWGLTFAEKAERVWAAAQMFISVIGNVGYIIYSDVHLLQQAKDSQSAQMYLLGEFMWKGVQDALDWSGEQVVVALELGVLMVMLLNSLYFVVAASLTSSPSRRWRDIYLLFWRRIPELSTFTAMKLLFYVDPWVVSTQTTTELHTWKQLATHGFYFKTASRVLRYLLWHAICLLVGVNAFFIKLRHTSADYVTKESMNIWDLLGCLMFIFQVLAVVNVTSIVRTRLFFFVFGGEDCTVTSREKAKEIVWNALLAKKVWETHGFLKFCIIMLSFTDYDMQHLLLHVKKTSA